MEADEEDELLQCEANREPAPERIVGAHVQRAHELEGQLLFLRPKVAAVGGGQPLSACTVAARCAGVKPTPGRNVRAADRDHSANTTEDPSRVFTSRLSGFPWMRT